MVPVRVEGNYVILKCTRCGYEIKADKKTMNSYRIRYQVDKEKHVVTSKAVEARKTGLTPEEREMLQEYYEIFLESFQEESGED
jgi:DNA-directed RNA polymerase subunit M